MTQNRDAIPEGIEIENATKVQIECGTKTNSTMGIGMRSSAEIRFERRTRIGINLNQDRVRTRKRDRDRNRERDRDQNRARDEHVPLTGADDSRMAQCLVNTAGEVVLPNQVFSNSFSPEPLHADEHYHIEE
ncbi:hypothetical protein EVAR_18458_1 [Eumeta japonica]|uniref:Uncharacterized protein n=1 Tax=Eumeta variegata TaxID=151549 RepID=A0A4C1V0A5_EUMVA|nr:hypothetical protein EVAR_18458_1 [Eumeta japonica]